jgi:hypothetical protein
MLNQNIVWEPKKCFHSDVIVGKQPPNINNVENPEWLFPNLKQLGTNYHIRIRVQLQILLFSSVTFRLQEADKK